MASVRAVARYVSPEELKLYRLIWNRFVASQMSVSLSEITTALCEHWKPGVRLMFWSGADFGEAGLDVVGKKFKDANGSPVIRSRPDALPGPGRRPAARQSTARSPSSGCSSASPRR